MFGVLAISALMGGAAPQDTATLDVAVYESRAYGVSLPRPFDDWVFSPGAGRLTTTVIFHPRGGLLREQLWGALILAPYPGEAQLDRVADERVEVSWRGALGAGFRLLARESLTVAGHRAMHIVVSGAINRVALDVEEYLVGRGRDLIVLQFRYPRGLPRDSVAAGYQRAFEGVRIRGAESPPARAAVTRGETERLSLAASPWRVRAYDAAVRYDPGAPALEFAVRMDLVNDGAESRDSVAFALPPWFRLDSARTPAGRAIPFAAGSAGRLLLPGVVPGHGSAAIVVYYRLASDAVDRSEHSSEDLALSGDEARLAVDWLPRVEPLLDSAGHGLRTLRPRHTVRFDLPGGFRAVAPGRLTSDLAAAGRRRMTWAADDVTLGTPGFAIGPYRLISQRAGRRVVSLWLPPSTSGGVTPSLQALVRLVESGWAFYSLAFGELPIPQLHIVACRARAPRGLAGLIMVNPESDSPPEVVLRELARTWWGNSVLGAGPGSGWLREGLPAWSAIAARGVLDGDSVRQRLVREAEAAWRAAVAAAPDVPLSADGPTGPVWQELLRAKGVAALEAARRAAGEARFREAIRTYAVEHRNGWATLDEFLALLGPDAAAVLRPFLFAR